jgi:hypothetical protein
MRRIRHSLVLVAFALVACRHTPAARPTADFTLTVRTAADAAPQFITVTLLDDNRSASIPLTRSPAGTFTATLPVGTERVALDLSIPEHVPLRTKLWLPTLGPAEFTIRPRALIPRKTITALRVIGDFNNFNTDSAVTLTADGRGRLRATIPFGVTRRGSTFWATVAGHAAHGFRCRRTRPRPTPMVRRSMPV